MPINALAIEVVLPKVDMDMESGVIAAWKVAEGDVVREGDVLFEMETNKSVMDVEAPASGTIRALAAITGDPLPVGTRVAWIDDNGIPQGNANGESGIEARGNANIGSEIARETARVERVSGTQNTTGVDSNVGSQSNTRDQRKAEAESISAIEIQSALRATPLARQTARVHGIDLAKVPGSGPRGRINEHDVEAYVDIAAKNSSTARLRAAPDRKHSTSAGPRADGTDGSNRLVPFNPVRRIIAQRLSESTRTVPHFYLTAQVEMTALLSAMKEVSPDITAVTGVKPSMTLLLAHLVGKVLMDHPLVNASIEGDAARLHASAHIGIAMDCEGDLLVPVLRDVQSRSLIELARELGRLRDAVRSRSIAPSDMRGGTFTISNLGMYGVDTFTAIINPPESAILAIGRSTDTPVGRDGQIVLRPMATLSLSSDHRIVDGITAARFMADLRRSIEDPPVLLRDGSP